MTQSDLSNRRAYIIGQLRGMGVHSDAGKRLEELDYRTLVALLALRELVAE